MIDYEPGWALAQVRLHSKAIKDGVDQLSWPTNCELPTPKSGTPYGRMLLTSTESAELVLIRWRPGSSSAIHDHSGGHGTVFVLQGEIDETSWESPSALVACSRPRRTCWSQGSAIPIHATSVHTMAAGRLGPTITLHFYLNATLPMTIYDMSASRRLLVPPNHGAWLPDTTDILEEFSWANP